MSQDNQQLKLLQRALEREKAARKAAEKILEEKSRELYTTSQQLQNLLDEKSNQLQGVFENIIDAYVVMDLQGNVLKFNEAATKLFGYNIEEEQVNVVDLIYKEDYEYAMSSFFQLYTNGFFKDYEARAYTKSKAVKWVHINASIIYDKQKKPIAAQGIVRDITEDKRLKKQFEDQKNQLSIIINNSPIGISLSKTEDKGLLLINQSLSNMLGYTREEFNKMQVQDITHPEDEEVSRNYREQLFNGDIDRFNLEKRYIKKDGSILWAKTNVIAVRNASGDIDYQVATIEDVSKEYHAKQKLIESENRLFTLIQNLDSGVLLEDENRSIVLTNTKFCELFKIPLKPEELIGQDCSNAAQQSKGLFKNPEQFVQRINDVLKSKDTVLADELIMCDGKILERDFIPIIENNKYRGHLWSYTDVTLKRTYSKTLEAQKQKYYSIIANMDLGLIESDLDGRITMVNQSLLKMTGYNEEEILGKRGRDIFPVNSNDHKVKQIIDKRNNTETTTFELEVKRKNGEKRFWFVSGYSNLDSENNKTGSLDVVLDITDLKTLELQKEKLLQRLEKSNDELQEYAHVVSHDLKSPLRSIHALISWLKEDNKGKLDQTSLNNIDLIEGTLEKMEQLISDVLNYSSVGSEISQKKQVDLCKMVKHILGMIYIPEHISIEVKQDLPTVNGDATKLQQLFQNLLSNAIKFIDKPKGLIEIDVQEKGAFYQFSIKDNGIGIEKKFHEKIFKIFHALNKSKDSTGIGLSIVKKIVNLHEGEIWLESEPKIGTTFYFTLKK